MSEMVIAKKYELQAKTSKGGRLVFDVNGQKLEKHGNKIMPRDWVEERNSQENNEIYVIDEEATKGLFEKREEAIKLKNSKAAKEKITMADLVDAIVESKPKKETKTGKDENKS